jgi:hypothetical protein
MTYTDYKDFLYDYFRQLHLNGMGPFRRAKLDELREAGQLNDEQKKWDPGNQPPDLNGHELVNHLSMPVLPDEEIDKLYRDFMLALRGMDDNRDEISKKSKGGAIIGKLDRFFGENMPFDKFEVKDKTPIEKLMEFLKGDENPVALYIRASLFNDEKEWKKFVKNAEEENYNEDFRDQLDYIFRNVPYLPQSDKTLKQPVDEFMDDFSDVPKIIDQSSQDLDQRKVRMFRQPEIYGQLLSLVAGDEDFRNEFARTTSGQKIVGAATQANETTNYENIGIKMTDRLTWWQRKTKAFNDAIDGHIGKLANRHKRHNYATPAKDVMNAIVAEGISSTDGLGKILEKAEDVKKRIEGGKSLAGFDQFVAVMGDIKKGMPKAFAGCLKHSDQMEAVKDAVIRKFIASGKFNETKIILEILGVMRYGALSSDKWAAWKENKISLFEGIKLDGFMKWFANGTDWALNRGVNALFWSVQAGSNLWHNRKRNEIGDELASDIDFYKDYDDPNHIKTFEKSYNEAAEQYNDLTVANDLVSEEDRAYAAFKDSEKALDAASKDREEKEKALEIASDAMQNANGDLQQRETELEAKKLAKEKDRRTAKQKRETFDQNRQLAEYTKRNNDKDLKNAAREREEKENALKKAESEKSKKQAALTAARAVLKADPKNSVNLDALNEAEVGYGRAEGERKKASDEFKKAKRNEDRIQKEIATAEDKAKKSKLNYDAAAELAKKSEEEFDLFFKNDYTNKQKLFKKAKKDYDDVRTEFYEAVKTEQDRRREYESAKKINDDMDQSNTFSLMDDLKEQRKSAAAGSGLLNKGKVAELNRKINAFDKKHAFEAAKKNLENKRNQPGVENEKKKYEQIVELLDFWNFQKTGAVRDIDVFRNHKKVQDQFTGDFQGKFSEYIAQHGHAA